MRSSLNDYLIVDNTIHYPSGDHPNSDIRLPKI